MRSAIEISTGDVALRLLVAAALSGAIGLERELRERAAGFRTHMLVGTGSALFTLVSAYGFADILARGVVTEDPTRIAAQIVTGIGFLGAGAILRQGLSIRGLTTAAGLWVVAAIGMAAGAGFYSAALITTGIVLVGLGPFRMFEGWLNRVGGDSGILEIELASHEPVSGMITFLRGRRARINGVELEDDDDRRLLRVEIELPIGRNSRQVAEELSEREEVRGVRWLE
ncbi:MAG TPA: MgtC/SapB family protein [Gaiellaceae bacterium]|jgi:putative Mg2+ transporter-C (MgtC) family protein